MPKFSIVVPAYNAEATLAETLDAIRTQSFTDWECVVVDDGSTDSTRALAAGYMQRDSRFRVVWQDNLGTAGAYNTGVREARADLVVICSADDLLLPEHLESMREFVAANPKYEIYSSNGEYLSESGARSAVYRGEPWSTERSLSLEDVLGCCFFSVGVVYRRPVFDLVGGYRLGVYGEDYDFWLRAMAGGARHRYSPRILSLHRVSAAQKSADILRVYASNIEVYRNLLEDHLVTADQEPMVETAILARRALIVRVIDDMAIARVQGLTDRFRPLVGYELSRLVGKTAVPVFRRLEMRRWKNHGGGR